MSGLVTTINGASIASQFTAAAGGPSAIAALNQLGNISFSGDSVNGAYTAVGAVSVSSGVTSATFSNASVVFSFAQNASLTVNGS
jgi:hypothetical protein